jgi:hypothetical protein
LARREVQVLVPRTLLMRAAGVLWAQSAIPHGLRLDDQTKQLLQELLDHAHSRKVFILPTAWRGSRVAKTVIVQGDV